MVLLAWQMAKVLILPRRSRSLSPVCRFRPKGICRMQSSSTPRQSLPWRRSGPYRIDLGGRGRAMRLDGGLGRATFPDMSGDLGVDATTLMIALPGDQQHQDE